MYEGPVSILIPKSDIDLHAFTPPKTANWLSKTGCFGLKHTHTTGKRLFLLVLKSE